MSYSTPFYKCKNCGCATYLWGEYHCPQCHSHEFRLTRIEPQYGKKANPKYLKCLYEEDGHIIPLNSESARRFSQTDPTLSFISFKLTEPQHGGAVTGNVLFGADYGHEQIIPLTPEMRDRIKLRNGEFVVTINTRHISNDDIAELAKKIAI